MLFVLASAKSYPAFEALADKNQDENLGKSPMQAKGDERRNLSYAKANPEPSESGCQLEKNKCDRLLKRVC